MGKKTLFGAITVLVLGLGTTLMFQNCSKSSFSTASEEPGRNNSLVKGPEVDVSQPPIVNTGSGLVEVIGRCEPSAGPVIASSNANNKSEVPCSNEGTYEVCVNVPTLGQGTIQVVQQDVTRTETSRVVTTEVFMNTTVEQEIKFDITGVQVPTTTKGRITIICIPGSMITSTIYGNPQLGGGAQCPANGVFEFDVTLVAGLAGSSQRVVYVTQTTQSGTVTTVFTDVDNVVKTHTCSITYATGNTQICKSSAGTISGTCKGGAPVQVVVNGQVQSVVTCASNNSFSAKDIVLNKMGANDIKIKQKNAFNSLCEASKVMNSF